MTEAEIEMDLQIGELQRELNMMRRQRDAALEEALRLRHTLEHIYAKSLLAVQSLEVKEHDDKASY